MANMTNSSGTLRKMITHAEDPVRYVLPLCEPGTAGKAARANAAATTAAAAQQGAAPVKHRIGMNELLGRSLVLEWSGAIYCVACGRKTGKSFNQGYCFPCFRGRAECDSCIVRPELCHFHEGTCREPEWGQRHCMQPHVVYLANSSELKVGISRAANVPGRWMDQGAVQARPLFNVQSRRQSGLVEVVLKKYLSDRTNWRKMLQAEPAPLDLDAEAGRVLAPCREELERLAQEFGAHQIVPAQSPETLVFRYPVRHYPAKLKSHNLDKTPRVEGVLQGIKGQYLLLDSGVINMRKFGGYEVVFGAG